MKATLLAKENGDAKFTIEFTAEEFEAARVKAYQENKNQFTMAFNMIDRAIGETGGKNFSIRNTHAIILFKANIS